MIPVFAGLAIVPGLVISGKLDSFLIHEFCCMQHLRLTAEIQNTLSAARIEVMSLPDCPELKLYLLNQDFPTTGLSAEEMAAVITEPAYWVFCWASGQVLARYLLDNPELVRGKRIIDFGSGSAVAGVAAMLAGAREVIACDIDPLACLAAQANAELNGVELTISDNWDDITGDVDLILVADVLYDRENLPWLGRFIARANEVLVADSRVKNFDYPPYEWVGEYSSSTQPDLDEFDEFRKVRLYRASAAGYHSD
jgi:predicted nicotinamide N-methyase